MAAAIRFYLDENIPVVIADQLRRRGIEVVTVRDLGLRGETDDNHLQHAAKMGYVLCTHDSDFIELAKQGHAHAGIVWGRPDKHGIGEWVKYLELLHSVYSAEDMVNTIEYVKK